MLPFTEKSVEDVFDSYPEQARPTMLALRDVVFTAFQQTDVDGKLTETLKWGEPSYLCQSGSTLRIHWKESDPGHCRVFFHCQTNLVETFRELYLEAFEFEGNRAIRLKLGEDLDLTKLAHCMELSLQYHLVKNQPLLGAKAELNQ